MVWAAGAEMFSVPYNKPQKSKRIKAEKMNPPILRG
jgi:hypothetical protein